MTTDFREVRLFREERFDLDRAIAFYGAARLAGGYRNNDETIGRALVELRETIDAEIACARAAEREAMAERLQSTLTPPEWADVVEWTKRQVTGSVAGSATSRAATCIVRVVKALGMWTTNAEETGR